MKSSPSKKGVVVLGVAIAASALAYDPMAHAAEPKRVLALTLAIAAAAYAIVKTNRVHNTHTLPWSSKLALGFLGLSALSALWGGSAAWLDLGTWIAAAVCAMAAASMGRESAVRAARTAASVTGAIVSLWAIATVFRGQHGFAVHAGQGNPNWLGLLIAVTLPLSIDSLLNALAKQRHWATRSAALVAVLVQPAALYASHSRVAWVATAFAAMWMIWRGRSHIKAIARRGAWMMAASALLTLAVIAMERHSPSPSLSPSPRVTTASSEPSQQQPQPEDAPIGRSLTGRKTIALRSLEASRHAGIFGAGLGNFGSAYLTAQGEVLAKMPVRSASRGFINATTAHNEVLQVAVESGPITALVLVLVFAFAFLELGRARDHAGDAAAAATIAMAIASLGDSPLRQPSICLLFGLICATVPRGVQRHNHRREVARGSTILALASATLLLLPATRAWLGTRALEGAFLAPAEDQHVRFERATRIDPSNADAWLALGTHELARGDADAAIAHLTRSDNLAPSIAARVALGEAHLAVESPANAIEALKGAYAFAPGSLRTQLAMAEAESQLGHLDEARLHVEAAHAVAPFDPHVRELRDRLHEEAMDTD